MELISEITTVRGGDLYHIDDGFFFRIYASNARVAYMRCVNRHCNAKAKMPLLPEDRVVASFETTVGHTHEPDHYFAQVNELRMRIIRRCQEIGMVSRRIFDDECSR